MLAHCYTPHCTPGSSPYAYKREVQGPLTEGWPRGEGRDGARARLLAPPAWTLVSPYCKRIRPGRGANTKATGSTSHACLPLASSPLRVPPRADPSGLGHATTIYSSVQGPPGVETPTTTRPLQSSTSFRIPATVYRKLQCRNPSFDRHRSKINPRTSLH
jgi:hypothetical protein